MIQWLANCEYITRTTDQVLNELLITRKTNVFNNLQVTRRLARSWQPRGGTSGQTTHPKKSLHQFKVQVTNRKSKPGSHSCGHTAVNTKRRQVKKTVSRAITV